MKEEPILVVRTDFPKAYFVSDKILDKTIKEEQELVGKLECVSMDCWSAVYDNIDKYPKERFGKGLFQNTFSFLITILGEEYIVTCNNIFFGDMNIYRAFRGQNKKIPNTFDKENRTITFYLDWSNGKELGDERLHITIENLIFDNFHIINNNDSTPAKEAEQAYQWLTTSDDIYSEYGCVRNAFANTNLYKKYRKFRKSVHCKKMAKTYAKYIGRVTVKAEADLRTDIPY